ncbi:hypothetical protein GZ77_03525 [Endozoicomonas montiporae]|uniref:N-acetyltransferase domain-containing protein n=2 Tax=Endozoicomonas montiporae TaxID=1027273 RepID=A0A081NB40_9GAMM|nr:hypothetical protein [Endozoicomonas montiporae]AMO56627.1 hypothetical protein EZMO1_2548 [Endozoicomonas montiporae CL-33]KEQ15663.1 hypothetical protein GZ77_03525 [Endozoicomonas montiporae]
MADQKEKVTFNRQRRLTGTAYRALRDTFYGYDFRREIETGQAELWKVNGGRLWLITRIENGELVVCCAAGRGLVSACVYLLAAAKKQGLKSIRFHTFKPAFARFIKQTFSGFQKVEQRSTGETIYQWMIN